MHQRAFRAADPFGQCAYQTASRARYLVDRDAAVVSVRDVEATRLVEIDVMGAALMVRAEMVDQPQGFRVEHHHAVVVDVRDEQMLAVRRELDVVRIVERSGARPQKLVTKRIARDGRRRERQ
tara:strand:+ start:1766 stop:2134 length:369 start_codon:yes stop_codon:yes gene_type:complete